MVLLFYDIEGGDNMSKTCKAKSAVLNADLKKIGFTGGFFNLCPSCLKKYGMIVAPKKQKSCVFGCNV